MAACSAARRRSITTLGRPLRTTSTLQTWSTRRAARWYPSHGRSRARPMSRIFRASCRAAAGQGRGRCHRAQLRTHARASVSVRPLSGLTGLSTQAGAAVRDDQPRVPFPDPISAPRFLSPGIRFPCLLQLRELLLDHVTASFRLPGSRSLRYDFTERTWTRVAITEASRGRRKTAAGGRREERRRRDRPSRRG